MSVFTVLNIGTGHTRNEPDNILVRLFTRCAGADAERVGGASQLKLINDGIGADYDAATGEVSKNYFAQATGWGLKDKSRDTVAVIARNRPQTVNLVGHSRGAIIATRIAAQLADRLPGTRCNLFLIDPVKRSLFGSDHDNAQTHENVGLFRQVLMENESSIMFEPQTITHSAASTNTVRMPGTHGTATQTGQPIGVVAYMLAVNFLRTCGSEMLDGPFTQAQIADAYASITLANPARRSGGRVGRSIRDMSSGAFGFKGLTNRGLAAKFGATNPFSHHAYFINPDHARHFASQWPNAFLALTGKAALSFSAQLQLKAELQRMRGQASRAWQALPPAFHEMV